MASDISEQLRAEIARRANHRCEYCLIHEDDAGFSHEVDHILSRKHGGLSTLDNLAYVNGVLNAKFAVPEVPKGYWGLEAEGFKIEFRNLKFKILE